METVEVSVYACAVRQPALRTPNLTVCDGRHAPETPCSPHTPGRIDTGTGGVRMSVRKGRAERSLAVACPTCGVSAREECLTRYGHPVQKQQRHTARLDKADGKPFKSSLAAVHCGHPAPDPSQRP